jgi:DNA-binding NarL/FixJ family response regulator
MTNNGGEAIKIAIVDDEALITTLLAEYFSRYDGLKVLYTASSGEEIIKLLQTKKPTPDVILLDLQMGGMDGMEAASALKQEHPNLKIVIISSHYKKSFMGYMLKLGVNAFLPKGIAPNLLVEAILEVQAKGFYFMNEQVEVMRNQISSNVPEPALTTEESLSDREVEILKLICQQLTAQQIADKLFITKRTVEGHKGNLLLKTGAKNTAGLVVYAIQKGIISIDECLFAQ